MAFQDFDQITERRKAVNARKLKKKIIIAVVAVILLVLIIVAALVIMNKMKTNKTTKTASKPAAAAPKKDAPKKDPPPKKAPTNKQASTSAKIVKEMCGGTDYKDKCNEVFSKASSDFLISRPKQVIKTVISGASDEAKAAFTKASELTFNSNEEKAAFEDCKALFEDAKEELEESMYQVGNSTASGKMRTGVLNSWLSAVISYQQTCIDGFPDGNAKSQMKKTLQSTKELTSNSLAMISLLSELKAPGSGGSSGASRRLLEQDTDGFPTWLTHDERRMLKKNDEKPTPNVTVAKDGSGNYKSISEALSAMPEKYKGRFVYLVLAV